MKTTSAILASAVALAISVPAYAAGHASGATVYGKSRAVIKITDNGTEDAGMDAGSTRFGFKGAEDLGNGLSAVYKLEMGLKHVDKADPKGRNGYVGLKGDFGQVLFGASSSPIYALVEGYFNWSMSAAVGFGTLNSSSTAESIVYSNKFGGAKVMAMLTSENGDDDVINGTSFGASLPVGPVTISAGVESDVGGANQEKTSIGVTYSDGALSAGLGFIDDDSGNDLLLVQASFKAGDTKFIAQMADKDNAGDGTTIGIHHSLSKRTTLLLELNGGDYDDHTGIGINHNF